MNFIIKFQPWSLLEVGLFTLALFVIYNKHYWSLIFVIIITSLNRETGLFIPVLFLLANLNIKNILTIRSKINWKPIILFCLFSLIYMVIFFTLRYLRGTTLHVSTIEGLLKRNITKNSLLYTFINGSLFLGGFWIFTILGFKYAPSFIKKVALIIPFYLITIIIWGVWYEVRLLIPLYSIFIPLGLSFIYHQLIKDDFEIKKKNIDSI